MNSANRLDRRRPGGLRLRCAQVTTAAAADYAVTIEIDGIDKPALVAEWLTLIVPDDDSVARSDGQ
jgi:hypothetical protein